MKHYYALFKKTRQAVEVEFPDLPGCVTYANDWDEAMKNAIDVLGGWLAHAEQQFIKPASSHKDLEHLSSQGTLVPIPVDEHVIESYQALKRFNVIFPIALLHRIDKYRKAKGVKRSTLLLRAAEEYLERHQAAA